MDATITQLNKEIVIFKNLKLIVVNAAKEDIEEKEKENYAQFIQITKNNIENSSRKIRYLIIKYFNFYFINE